MSKVQNSGQTTFINPRFDLIRLWIQDHIGQFIVGLLILTYLGTGFVIGIALQKGLIIFGVTLSWLAGMGVSLIAQLIRGTLVYFSQANPYRLNTNGHIVGGVIAAILTIYAGFEVFHLLTDLGISNAVKISVIGVIIAGFFLEVFFLNELTKINHAVLVSDPELFQNAIEHEQKLVEIKSKVGEAKIQLLKARRERFSKALNQDQEPDQEEAPAEEEHSPTPSTGIIPAVIIEAIAAYKIKPDDLKKVLAMVEANFEHYIILTAIQQLAKEKELQSEEKELHPEVATIPLDFSLNGNGKH